jgi:hypothetical protein
MTSHNSRPGICHRHAIDLDIDIDIDIERSRPRRVKGNVEAV